MNSPDPWRIIATDSYGNVVLPRPRYGNLFIGADARSAPSALLSDVAPMIAPAARGISIKKELDDKQVLHVEICVDGKCYRTSMDLAPAIAMVMQKLSRWHDGQHAQPSPSALVSTVQSTVGIAGDVMADSLVGNWLSDIGGAIGGTLRQLQPVISTVATGVATAYGGPVAGAAAGKLVPMWTGLQADLLDPKGSAKKKKAAAQAIQRVNQVAASDPAAAQALAAAHQAVKNTAVAYHVKNTAKKAAEGDPTAQVDLSALVSAAEQGDPTAKQTFEVVANALGAQLMGSDAGAKLWQQLSGQLAGQGTAVVASGWYDVVGAAVDDVRERARTFANAKHGGAAGVVQTVDGRLHGRGFRSLDEAIDWLQRVSSDRSTFTYAAAFEKAHDGSAYIQDEEFGGTQAVTSG